MKLHFLWSDIEKLLAEVITAQTARPLFGEATGKGLWLVGDEGVYLMANTVDGDINAARKEGDKPFVAYAEECNPLTLSFDAWWNTKRATFGADDGVEFFPLDGFIAFRRIDPTHLVIEFRGNTMQLLPIRRKGATS